MRGKPLPVIEKPERFRCSKAPLRFPIWSHEGPYRMTETDTSSNPTGKVVPPTRWSDWYQLIGVIGGPKAHYAAVSLTEGGTWIKYDDANYRGAPGKPVRSSPEEIIPRMLIFSKVKVLPEKVRAYEDYNEKRMLAAAEWYNKESKNFKAPREGSEEYIGNTKILVPEHRKPPMFEIDQWKFGFDAERFRSPDEFDPFDFDPNQPYDLWDGPQNYGSPETGTGFATEWTQTPEITHPVGDPHDKVCPIHYIFFSW